MNLTFFYNPNLTLPKFRISAASSKTTTIPPRDRIIDFGKHKGKMLGTLPSTYLKWVSKNLRARDFEEWAKLADQVLIDPVYKDRIEWEFAENILNGNSPKETAAAATGAVSELLEISERFGWDNLDKSGWSRIDFGLLGTSKGGRIPRVNGDEKIDVEIEKKKEKSVKSGVDGGEEDGGRRKERRERLRLRQMRGEKNRGSTSLDAVGTSVGSGSDGGEERVRREDGGVFPVSSGASPFPGREALLRKALNRRKLI